MYWCDTCDREIPAATVFEVDGGLFHRKGAEILEDHLEGDVHRVRQLADTHEPSLAAD